jgi:hypothetical protein
MTAVMDKPLEVQIALKNRVYVANLFDELQINTGDITNEVLNHPPKLAWWETLYHLADLKVKIMYDKCKQNDSCGDDYETAVRNCELIRDILEALNHRKSALLKLWINPQNKEAMREYYTILKGMGIYRP